MTVLYIFCSQHEIFGMVLNLTHFHTKLMLNFLNLSEVVSAFALVSVAVSEPGYYHHGYSHYGGYGHHGYYGKREAEAVAIAEPGYYQHGYYGKREAVAEPGYYGHGYSHHSGYGHHGYYGKREAEPVYIDFDNYGINGHINGY